MGIYIGEEKMAFRLGSQRFLVNDTPEESKMKTLVIGNPIVITDAKSEIHPLEIYLSSDTLTDFSTLYVRRYGRNLLDWKSIQKINTTSFSVDIYLPKGTYNFNSNFHKIIDESVTYGVFLNEGTSTNYQNALVTVRTLNGKTFIDNFTIEKSGNYNLLFRLSGSTTVEKLGEYLTSEENNAQISLGDEILDIEPFVEPQTVQSDANGVVEGLTSLSPNMTLFADNDKVTINLKYFKEAV